MEPEHQHHSITSLPDRQPMDLPIPDVLVDTDSVATPELQAPLLAVIHIFYSGAKASKLCKAALNYDQDQLVKLVHKDMKVVGLPQANKTNVSWTPMPIPHATMKWALIKQEAATGWLTNIRHKIPGGELSNAQTQAREITRITWGAQTLETMGVTLSKSKSKPKTKSQKSKSSKAEKRKLVEKAAARLHDLVAAGTAPTHDTAQRAGGVSEKMARPDHLASLCEVEGQVDEVEDGEIEHFEHHMVTSAVHALPPTIPKPPVRSTIPARCDYRPLKRNLVPALVNAVPYKHAQYDWQRDMNNSIQDGRHLYSKLCEAERHITHIQDRDEALEDYIRALETHIKGLSRRTMDAEKALGIVQSKLGDATAEMDHAIVLRAEDLQKAEEDARARQDRITALEAEFAAVYAQAEGNQPQLVGTTTVPTVNTGILQPSRNASPSVTKAECLPARAKRLAPVPENGEINSDGLMKRPRVHRVVHSQRRVKEESNDAVQLHALPMTQSCRNVKMQEVEGNVRLPLTQDNLYQAVTQNERSELGWDVDRQTLLYESAAQARMIIQLQDELANARDVAVQLRLSLDLSAGRVEQAGDLLTQANEWMEETKLKQHQPSFEHFPTAIFDVARLIARTASASTAVAV